MTTDAQASQSNASILVADGDTEFLLATCVQLRGDGYTVHAATDEASALLTLRAHSIDVILVDSRLAGDQISDFVRKVRDTNRTAQVVLLSSGGQEHPSRSLLRTLDIQACCDKSEGAERILLWTHVAVKAQTTLTRLERSRHSLDCVLSATARFHKRHEKGGLYAEILERTARLVSATGAILALFPDALGEDGDLLVEEVTGASARVVAGWGSYETARDWTRILAGGGFAVVRRSMSSQKCQLELPWMALALRVGEHVLGFIALKVETPQVVESEVLDVLSLQASVAIQNALYYEMAALDPLTLVHARRFFDVWTRREVRAAARTGAPLSLLFIDMDGLKGINDRGGHRVGDNAIGIVGRVLRETTREHDLAARLGGDEFAMLLPNTDLDGACVVAQRILELLGAKTVLVAGKPVPVSASIGVAMMQSCGPCPAHVGRVLTVEFFEELVERLVRRADDALYQAKRSGRGCYCRSEGLEISWSITERPARPSSFELG